MTNEIGSEFWIERVTEETHQTTQLFAKGDLKLTLSGRTSILYVLNEIDRRVKTKKAYLPSYCCETMIKPFLSMGYTVVFYEIDFNFDPQIDLHTIEQGSVLLCCDYFGFISSKSIDAMTFCKENNMIVIHDITMSVFSYGEYNYPADYLVGSFRKWLAVPCGGFAVSIKQPFTVKLCKTNQKYVDMRINALQLKGKYIRTPDPKLKQEVLDCFYAAERLLDTVNDCCAGDAYSSACLTRYPYEELITRRRANFSKLLDGFSSFASIKPLHTYLAKNICPMFFVVYIDSRDAYRQYLIENHIYSPIHWPLSEYHKITSNVNSIHNAIISIPCDQRYDELDMNRIIEVTQSYLRSLQ